MVFCDIRPTSSDDNQDNERPQLQISAGELEAYLKHKLSVFARLVKILSILPLRNVQELINIQYDNSMEKLIYLLR